MKARLVAGSIRLGQATVRNLAPGGKIFNDIRPPHPGELAAGLGGLAGGVVNGKSLLYRGNKALKVNLSMQASKNLRFRI